MRISMPSGMRFHLSSRDCPLGRLKPQPLNHGVLRGERQKHIHKHHACIRPHGGTETYTRRLKWQLTADVEKQSQPVKVIFFHPPSIPRGSFKVWNEKGFTPGCHNKCKCFGRANSLLSHDCYGLIAQIKPQGWCMYDVMHKWNNVKNEHTCAYLYIYMCVSSWGSDSDDKLSIHLSQVRWKGLITVWGNH